MQPLPMGTTVFVPWADSHSRVKKPCPVCFGKLSVMLTLGNGETTSVLCEFCARGYGGPTGTVDEYAATSGVHEYTICGAVLVGVDRWEYYVSEHTAFKDTELYTDRAMADAVREAKLAEARVWAQRNFESQFVNAKKKISWTVGYHRAALKDLERKVEWHQNKLREAKK